MRRAAILIFLLFGCGGGGPSPGPLPPRAEILRWEQPPWNADNTPLDIQRDVSRFDIYCSDYPIPLDNEIVASVASPDNTSFNLKLLRQYGIAPGPDGKLVFIKCIRIDKAASDFSAPAEWRN